MVMRDVPALPATRELTLEDSDWLGDALAAERPDASELTFTNLFIWRHAYGLRLAQAEGALCLFAWRSDSEESFLLPPVGADGPAPVEAGLRHLQQAGHDAKLARVSSAQLERLGIGHDAFVIEEDRDNWDYVYSVADLIELPGNAYHDKRNHIAQFRAKHEFEYRSLTPDLVPACRELQDLWCDEKHCDLVATLRAESRAVKEALENLDSLRAVGGCIVIEGRVQAFALGEALTDDTVVIHIEKANATFHGLYQIINQQFLARQWPDTAYVNREQDMGVAGLRRAKQSYDPHHMVQKHIVRLKA
jgi:hypothetical protein